MRARDLILLAWLLGPAACEDEPEPPVGSSGGSAEPAPAVDDEPRTASSQLLERLDDCDVLHSGLLLDLGTTAADSEREFAVGPFDDTTTVKNGGASFAEYRTRRVGYQFWLRQEVKDVQISLRGIAGASRRASVYLDHRRLGTAVLSPDEARVVPLPTVDRVEPGLHKVSLRFSGTPKTADEAFAQVDWIRFGTVDGNASEYAAPTRERLLADVVLGAVPRRSALLSAPGALRCPVHVGLGTRLEIDVGFWGTGKGKADVRVLAPGAEPVVLTERRVVGGKGAAWSRLSLPLEEYRGRVVSVELRATQATPGGRVAFGEPAVVVNDPAPHPVPKAKVAVIVVGAGLDRRLVPPWGHVAQLPHLGRLARHGVAFDGYRAPTTAVAPVMATLLTGSSPRAHAMEEPLSRLPNEVRAIGEIVKEASGRTAMFTGVPTSFAAFGFDRGWNRYDAYSPVRDLPATHPIEQAAAWLASELEEQKGSRYLLVVHTRGGHPPWDLNETEAAALPPEEYVGPLQPRRGAITLAELRASRSGHLSGDDWRRLGALEHAALRKQDRALGLLMSVLEEHQTEVPYLLAFMGDVGAGDPPHWPFAPAPPLTEDHLIVPLVMVFPDGKRGGTHVGEVTTTVDVTATVLRALGVPLPANLEGRDLYRVASGFEAPNSGAHTATLGADFATRWGPWLLRGALRRTPELYQVQVDPACAHDVLPSYPGVGSALWRQTYAAVTGARSGVTVSAEPAAFDPETLAALKVFGYGY